MAWQYKTVSIKKRSFFSGNIDPEYVEEELNRHAQQGWELAQMSALQNFQYRSTLLLVFKKPR